MKPNKDLKKLENIQKIKENDKDNKCQIYKIDFKNIEIPN